MTSTDNTIAIFLWNGLLLASFWGMGSLARRCLPRDAGDMGAGTTWLLGIGVFLAAAGPLLALGRLDGTIMLALVLTGAAGGGWSLLPLLRGAGRWSRAAWCALGAAVFGLLFAYAVAGMLAFNANDDYIGYLPMVERLLQTGDLLEPFSARRAGMYGGHIVLQAASMLVGSDATGFVLEYALAPVLILALLAEITRDTPPRLKAVRCGLIALVLLLPYPGINTASTSTSLLLLLGLLHCLQRLADAPSRPNVLVAAVVAAAGCTMRPTTIIYTVLFSAGFFLWRLSADTPRRRHWALLGSAFVLLVCLLLLPWMVALYRSSGTPLYPPFLGNLNPEFIRIGDPRGRWYDVVHAGRVFAQPLLACFGLALASAALPDRRSNGLALVVAGAAALGAFVIACGFGSAIAPEIYRYTYPGLAAATAWVGSCSLLMCRGRVPWGRWVCAAAAFGLLAVVSHKRIAATAERMAAAVSRLGAVTASPVPTPLVLQYRTAQWQVPAGAKILAVCELPGVLDYRRNEIANVDIIGAASPGRGLPLGQGGAALSAYLRSRGYRYLLAEDFDTAGALYARSLWQNHPRPERYFREVWGRYALLFMADVDALAAPASREFPPPRVRVIPLAAP